MTLDTRPTTRSIAPMRNLDADTATIAETIGGELARRMLAAGYAPDAVFDESLEACNLAAQILDRVTRAAHETEHGDADEARLILNAADHFRACLWRRLPIGVDLRIVAGDSPAGVTIVA